VDASSALRSLRFEPTPAGQTLLSFTQVNMRSRLAQIAESVARYLSQLDNADRQGEAVPEAKITRLNEKIATLREEIQGLNALNSEMIQSEDKQIF